MDEQHPPARVVDPRTLILERAPPARAPFDPALLLEGREPPPSPYATGPAVVVVKEFDPATFLGERAFRGAFNLATVKPLVTTVGGVEMVTIPASAYSDALRRIAAQELPPETVERAGPMLDAAGMLDLLLSLHAAEIVSTGQLAAATGLDHLDIGDQVAAYATRHAGSAPVSFVPPPEAARINTSEGSLPRDMPEAHGAALGEVLPTEAHGAALDVAKPEKRPRKGSASHEVP